MAAPTRSGNNWEIDREIRILRKRNETIGLHLPSFLRSGGGQIAFATCPNDDKFLAFFRVNPSPDIQAQFGITLEIPVVISLHDGLQPRVFRLFEQLRALPTVDQDIGILVVRDRRATQMSLDRGAVAFPVLVVLESDLKDEGFRSAGLQSHLGRLLRLVNHFEFSLDIQDPNQFFGRKAELSAIVEHLQNGQSVGLFGLRKSGKTSILHQTRALLQRDGHESALIQLNNISDSIEFREEILAKTAQCVKSLKNSLPSNLALLNFDGTIRNGTTDALVKRRWAADLQKLLDHANSPITLVIDEIDLANDDEAASRDNDFDVLSRQERRELHRVLRELRGAIQVRQANRGSTLTILVAGVAASITTAAIRYGQENQLFQFFTVRLLSPLQPDEMRQMVNTLGKRSGLTFRTERLFDLLEAEYGGHPHLTRRACSIVAESRSKLSSYSVPHEVNEGELTAAFEELSERSPLAESRQMLVSFGLWYPDEHKIIAEVLAKSEIELFPAKRVPHAVDFGIIDRTGSLKIKALRR